MGTGPTPVRPLAGVDVPIERTNSWAIRAGRALVGTLLVVPGAMAVPRAATAASDTTPPTILALAVTPGSIDTSGAAVAVAVHAHITDDLAGLADGGDVGVSTVAFQGPGGAQIARGYLSQAQRTSGSPLDGEYDTVVFVPRYAETGTWQASATLVDAVGNTATLSAADLAAAGVGAGFTQTGAGDATAPSVLSLTVSPTSIDTSAASATVVFTAHLTDDLAGVSSGSTAAPSQLVMRGPTGAHHVSAVFIRRVSGTATDGVYSAQVVVPHYAEQGHWTIESFAVYDNVGNTRTFGPKDLVGDAYAAAFDQTGAGDISAPTFGAFTLSSDTVDTSTSPAVLTMRAEIIDDLAGVAAGVDDSPSQVTFRSPSGTQQVVASFGLAQLSSGSTLDGWYSYQVVLPEGSEQGTWTMASARAVDSAHNASSANGAAWSTLGFATSFAVVSDGRAGPPASAVAAETASPGTVVVSFSAPTVTGSTPITGYVVTAAPGGTTTTVDAAANDAIVSGLTTGVTYTFTVHATNDAGNGIESAPSNPVTIGGVADTAAPQLTTLSITPMTADTTASPVTVTIDVGATDDISGLSDAGSLSSITLLTPRSAAGPIVTVAGHERISGTPHDGVYRASVELPRGAESGEWTIGQVALTDAAGHTASYANAQLVTLGVAASFTVVGATLPSAPTAVVATAGDGSVSVQWSPPGDDGGTPITGYTVTATPDGAYVDVDGSTTTATVTGLVNGTSYSFAVVARNAIGASEASEPSETVTPIVAPPPPPPDTTPPTLVAMSVTPNAIDLGAIGDSPALVAVALRASDDSGLADASGTITLTAPSGVTTHLPITSDERVSGTAKDGSYAVALSFVAGAEIGVWAVSSVELVDAAGNRGSYDAATVAADPTIAVSDTSAAMGAAHPASRVRCAACAPGASELPPQRSLRQWSRRSEPWSEPTRPRPR